MTNKLHEILKQNKPLYDIIEQADRLCIDNYYIGAGCITQTVWNYQLGYDLTYGISDVDFVYFSDVDLRVNLHSNVFDIDIVNQAKVHLWYKDYFGYDIAPYKSVEDAIATWPTTATAVGVRLEKDDLKVHAPFGLDDLFELKVRANKAIISEDVYLQKVKKWSSKWKGLTIIPW